jgi:hypothetical protein
VFYAGNDYSDLFRYFSKIPRREDVKPTAFVQWVDANVFRNRVLGKSYLVQLIKQTLFKRYFFAENRSDTLPPACGIHVNGKQMTSSALCIMAAKQKCINDLRDLARLAVDRLDDLSRKLKFVPIFMIIPDKAQVDRALLETKASRWGFQPNDLKPDLPDTILERELMRYGFQFIDVSECLKDRPELYYKMDDHFTPAGHRTVAEHIGKKLDELTEEALKTRSN